MGQPLVGRVALGHIPRCPESPIPSDITVDLIKVVYSPFRMRLSSLVCRVRRRNELKAIGNGKRKDNFFINIIS